MSPPTEPNYTSLLPGVRREHLSLITPDHLVSDTALFAAHIAVKWGLPQLRDVALATATELARWLLENDPSPVLRVVLTWDEPLLHVEIFDRGGLIPDCHVSRSDAALAVRLLTPPGVEWGAELDSRGRCLWAVLRTRPDTEDTAESSREIDP